MEQCEIFLVKEGIVMPSTYLRMTLNSLFLGQLTVPHPCVLEVSDRQPLELGGM